MITNKKFEQLKSFPTASFAVWPFDEDFKSFENIHCDLVVLGLNPSKDISFGQNFHGKRFDKWYEEAFSLSPFKGAYMTDLISVGEPSAAVIIEKWKDLSFRAKHVQNLKKQFEILNINIDTPIFCLGKNTENLFKSVFVEYKNIFSIGHPNSYRIKNPKKIFLLDIQKIGDEIISECFSQLKDIS